MKIEIVDENGKVYIIIDENKEELNFKKLDSLIEQFINLDALPTIVCDEQLKNYKLLIEEIYREVQSESFKKALLEAQRYNSTETTN